MIKWNFSIGLYHFVFLAAISSGFVFSCLLFFVNRINQKANCFLGLAVLVIILWMCWVLGIDLSIERYITNWNWMPLQFSLSTGPLIYWYVHKLIIPSKSSKPLIGCTSAHC